MTVKEINKIFGNQLRQLGTNDFERRTFKLREYVKNGI
tara:strand:+ start:2470 stop:2583 length:114 start_codon:yes stop_codon:yes gene_type:complete